MAIFQRVRSGQSLTFTCDVVVLPVVLGVGVVVGGPVSFTLQAEVDMS